MIPPQLQKPDFRFCLIRKQSKIPFEKEWQNKGYAFNDTKLLNHIIDGGNYGVIGGYGNLIILDKDSNKLPIDLDTFCIETGSGGKHYYILSDYEENHVFINEMGELRAKNYQVVGPDSIHPNGNKYKIFKDIPIKFIPKEELIEIIKPFLREEQINKEQTQKFDKKDTSRSGLEFRKILALLRKGKSREEIYKEMMAYSKWSISPEQYKTTTFEKAENIYLLELEKPQENKAKEMTEEEKEKYHKLLLESYELVMNILKRYLDWTEEKYNLATLWIIGTYNYEDFPTYPYLFLNAMKSSGKSRALNLITSLSYNGIVLNSLTEATMFRTKGTLGIDEFEGIERKGKESLRELLNSAYKKGTKVRRMKKVKSMKGEEMVVEEFDVYRPIVIANISGMESVLGDRCIPMIIEKSFNKKFINLIEIFMYEDDFKKAKELLEECRKCRCRYAGEYIEVYKKWNSTIITNTTNNTNNTNNIMPLQALKGLNLMLSTGNVGNLSGRELELFFPLLMIAGDISDEILDLSTLTALEIFDKKREEDVVENTDISLIDFLSQELEEKEKYYTLLTEILHGFQQFIGNTEEWLNTKWLTRALKRLDLVIESRRNSKGREVRLNITKAKDKIKMFK